MITIKLPHDHFHAGKRFKKGEEFTFTDEGYDWFMSATLCNREKHIVMMQAKVGTPEWAAKTVADSEETKRGRRAKTDRKDEPEEGE